MKVLTWVFGAVFIVTLAGFAPPATATSHSEPEQRAAVNREKMELLELKLTFYNANSAIHSVLEEQQAYEQARATGDEISMHENAADLLAALSEARYWTTVLDRLVTAAEFSQQTDEDVANLAKLIADAYEFMDDAFFAADLEMLNEGLDTSADFFRQLASATQNINAALWPKLSEA